MKLGCMLINCNGGSGARVTDHSPGMDGCPAEVDNFLTICLDSYFASIAADTPLVVVDDGSVDDSVDIIAGYEDRIARFIRKDRNEGLTPAMQDVADILIDEYECDAICRFDADIEFITAGWDVRFSKYFENHKDVGAVGGCQLIPTGAIWAFGDMMIHPEGYKHILGFSTYSKVPVRFKRIFATDDMVLGDMECDSVMGCLAAFRSEAYRKVGGLRDEFSDIRGETEDLNLRIQIEGYRCVALGAVQFIHRQMEHKGKVTTYDTQQKVRESFELWSRLWGWDKLKPDLKAVWNRWHDTPLARNLIQLPDGSVEYIGP